MKINISREAKEYLDKKSAKEITVETFAAQSCCTGGMPMPSVYPGPPKTNTKSYNVFNEDGYKIYIENVIKFKEDTCNIDMEKYLFAKNLTALFFDYKHM